MPLIKPDGETFLYSYAERAIEHALRRGADYADLRIQNRVKDIVTVSNGVVTKATYGQESGTGIRVIYNGAWGFASTNTLTKRAVMQSMDCAVKLASGSRVIGTKTELAHVKASRDLVKPDIKINPRNVSMEEKVGRILEIINAERAFLRKKVASCRVTYLSQQENSSFYNSEGSSIELHTVRTRLTSRVVVRNGARTQSYVNALGGQGGFEVIKNADLDEFGKRTAESGAKLLDAGQPPTGRFTIVTDPLLTGALAHEIFGHTTEADSMLSEDSVLTDKLYQTIASSNVSICDDPTYPNGWGSIKYDDEGTPAVRKMLLKNGILKELILTRETARKFNMTPNGGARAESYEGRPVPRMSNTFVIPRTHRFEELLEDIKCGIYCCGVKKGQVDLSSGAYQLIPRIAFLIENGKTTETFTNLIIFGSLLETLKNIDAVGRDFELWISGCEKDFQFVNVGIGGPHIRIKECGVTAKQ